MPPLSWAAAHNPWPDAETGASKQRSAPPPTVTVCHPALSPALGRDANGNVGILSRGNCVWGTSLIWWTTTTTATSGK